MKNKLLPIGSIVKLKGTDVLFIIAGYFPKGAPTPDHIYDYSGFCYPIGYTGTFNVFQFDREQIEESVAIGYQDKEQMEFIEKLEKDMSILNHKKI